MKARIALGLIVALAAWAVVLTGSAAGAPTLGSIFSFNRVEADPQKDYQLTERQGPWMILAATFSGEGAEDQARELMLELRRRYKLPAYVYKKRFDFGDDAKGRGVNQFGQPNRWVYRSGSEIEEIAVLAGEFDSVDATEAKETLKEIKYARPESLDLEKKKHTNQNLAAIREMLRRSRRRHSSPGSAPVRLRSARPPYLSPLCLPLFRSGEPVGSSCLGFGSRGTFRMPASTGSCPIQIDSIN